MRKKPPFQNPQALPDCPPDQIIRGFAFWQQRHLAAIPLTAAPGTGTLSRSPGSVQGCLCCSGSADSAPLSAQCLSSPYQKHCLLQGQAPGEVARTRWGSEWGNSSRMRCPDSAPLPRTVTQTLQAGTTGCTDSW